MNTAGYTRERRAAMTAEELIRIFDLPGRYDPERARQRRSRRVLAGAVGLGAAEGGDLGELASRAAAVFDILDPDEAVAIAVDASEIAAALDQRLWVKRIASTVARCAESRAVDGFTDWEKALDWCEACEHADNERKLEKWQLK
jgi:hypothetical protein